MQDFLGDHYTIPPGCLTVRDDQPLIPCLSGRPTPEAPSTKLLHRADRPRRRSDRHFREGTYGKWLRPILGEVCGRTLPPNSLRKSFATWTLRARLPRDHCEIYLGHETALAASVTGQHYVADLIEHLADELAPTCAAIEAAIAGAAENSY